MIKPRLYSLRVTDKTLDCIERALACLGDCLTEDDDIEQAAHVLSIVREVRSKTSLSDET